MGQKVNPHGLRVGVIKNWDSRWFASDETFGDTLVSDYNIRKYLKRSFKTQAFRRSRSSATAREYAYSYTAQSPVWLSDAAA